VKDRAFEGDQEYLEYRGIDSGNEVLQILADSLKAKQGEKGEDCAWKRRRTCVIGMRMGGLKFNAKAFEIGQRSQTSGHCFGWNVPADWYFTKREVDEARGR
jgi:hypothetical protein